MATPVILRVETAEQILAAQQLFHLYATQRNFDLALANIHQEIATLPGQYAPPDGLLLLAYWEGQTVGCVAYRKLSEQVCEMKRLFVLPEYRGEKIGKELVERLLEEARQAGYTKMMLDSHPSMKKAQALYAHFGFQPTERYNDNPIEGILFFEKLI